MKETSPLYVLLMLFAGACGPVAGAPARPSVQAFLPLLDRAASAAPPGVVVHDADGMTGNRSERMPSWGFSGTTESPFCAHSTVRRMDWRSAIAASQLGVPAVALAQADLQAEVLAEAGFVPIDAGSTTIDTGGERVAWMVRRADGGSGGDAALRPARLIHRRIYFAPGTSAFVIARSDYEAESGIATVELTCVEASPGAADRDPSLRVAVREAVTRGE